MKPSITLLVLLTVLMLATVDFDNQPHFQAHKVEHIIQKRVLTAEFEACDLSAAQMSP